MYQYLDKDSLLREHKEAEQKKLEQDKARKEEISKKLDQEIMTVRSEIEKNKDALHGLQSNRAFLLSLCPAKFLAERQQREAEKLKLLKNQWIGEHMANPALDYDIIFKTDDEIHEGVQMQFSFHGSTAPEQSNLKKTGPRDFSDHAKMKPKDWEHAFDTLFQLHLINVPNDFYSDKLYFRNTKELEDMFNKLELDNLQMIHQQQELEESYEDLLFKEERLHREMQSLYDEQNKARVELIAKIDASNAILHSLRRKTTDGLL